MTWYVIAMIVFYALFAIAVTIKMVVTLILMYRNKDE